MAASVSVGLLFLLVLTVSVSAKSINKLKEKKENNEITVLAKRILAHLQDRASHKAEGFNRELTDDLKRRVSNLEKKALSLVVRSTASTPRELPSNIRNFLKKKMKSANILRA